MEIFRILVQVFSIIIALLAVLQKEKWKIMLFYTVSNILSSVMYFAFGRTATAIICIVATVRTFIFMFYAYKKIKPNLFWLIIFEISFVLTTILTWQDALDLFPLIALLSAGYGSWQDNQLILRISYVINESLYVIYKAIIGAYISMVIDAMSLTCTITCLIYYCILKKETPILQAIFKNKSKQAVCLTENKESLENKKVDNDDKG